MHSFCALLRFHTPKLAVIFCLSSFAVGFAEAQNSPFAPGFDIDQSASKIEFGSVKFEKGEKVVEVHSFATFAGSIEESGDTKITVKIDSVDTKNDLRNVRMRFLFFESFKYPDGIVSLKLTPDMAEGLVPGSRKVLTVPFDLTIKEVTNRLNADLVVEVDNHDRFTVTSVAPVLFGIEDFRLSNNLQKIAETAGGFEIVPIMELTFDLTFNRREGGEEAQVVALEQKPPADTALETKGDFSLDECVGRFQILSETGNIYFASGSARLKADSDFVLRTILNIIERCSDLRIQISGHTDSDGSDSYNQTLSERRAQSVYDYLTRRGVDPLRLITAGFGEERPMVANDSDFNKSRNRRIEFSLHR